MSPQMSDKDKKVSTDYVDITNNIVTLLSSKGISSLDLGEGPDKSITIAHAIYPARFPLNTVAFTLPALGSTKAAAITLSSNAITKATLPAISSSISNLIASIVEMVALTDRTDQKTKDILRQIAEHIVHIDDILHISKSEMKELLENVITVILDNITIKFKIKGIPIPSFISKTIIKTVLMSGLNLLIDLIFKGKK